MDNARAALRRRINDSRNELATRIDSARADVVSRIDAGRGEIYQVRESILEARIWMLFIHVALALTLLFVIARGFRWL